MSAVLDRDTHRPTDPEVIGREVRRLYSGGLTARDVAACMRLQLSVVLKHLNPILSTTATMRRKG